jgi:hypothetical protein
MRVVDMDHRDDCARTDTRLRVLGATYLEPERHFTIPELVSGQAVHSLRWRERWSG